MTGLARLLGLGLLVQALPGLALERPNALPSPLPAMSSAPMPPTAMPPVTGLTISPAPLPTLPLPSPATTLPGLPGLPASPLASLPALPADTLPAATTPSAPCEFKTPQASLDFGAIPSGVNARAYAQPLLLQVACRQAAEFRFSTNAPGIAIGNAAEQSSLVVTLRGRSGSINGSAWVRLEQEGQALASRRFSVPAASPTLIALSAVLVEHPSSDRTPASSGSLESLVLAHHLYLIDGSEP